ncbi:flavodoxin [Mycobacteroides saopaulense]|uniref:flavodoxin family protein n=1 Tax=Mycobacteroides saopaulense TaxID=1578165 RepID=UPI00071F794D|nr:NAD(P)H-dependent oxidoreductase [Mycobacteroides saopaulense]ALR11790.1 flavodoxin [Mycobacteroides saopaulense]
MAIVQEPLRALSLICSLKHHSEQSSTELLIDQLATVLREDGIQCESVRCVDYDIHPGVEQDMGDGDQWPQLRDKVLGADILILGTPTWLGHMSSVAQRVLERLDAELSATDEDGRPLLSGKVAVAAVVGNEDGAHKITADLFQALNDIGYSVPAQGCTYWNGEAMHTTDYRELSETPKAVESATASAARNAAHLARLLREYRYPSG